MWRQLFQKLLADKRVIILSSIEQAKYDMIASITITLNIYNPLNIFVHKNDISSMKMIFDFDSEGGGLLMRAPL